MSRAVHILDLEPDLGADLDANAFAQARERVLAPLVDVGPGGWSPGGLARHPGASGRAFAGVICEGMNVREVVLADRVCTQLFGPGDLLPLDSAAGGSLPLQTRHVALGGLEVALLDDRFLLATRRWPQLAARLTDLTADLVDRTAVHQAISQLPRVADRLLALFWLLADRWGHVGPNGVAVRLPLTHNALGQLIGAARPTVSLGLRALADQQTLTRDDDGTWRLRAESLAVLGSGDDPTPVRAIFSRRRQRKRTHSSSSPVPPSSSDHDALLRRVAALRDRLGACSDSSPARNRAACERLTKLRGA